MAQGAYYEESAVNTRSNREIKIYKVLNVFFWIFVVFSALGVMLSFVYVPSMISETAEYPATRIFTLVSWFGGLAVVVLFAVFFWRMKLRRNISYDYLFVEDELRISKVFNGKKRKFLYKINADQILKIGYCDRPSFERTTAGLNKKQIRYLTPNEEPMQEKYFFYIFYSSTIEKTLYIIEARETMLEYLVRAAGRNKFERQ